MSFNMSTPEITFRDGDYFHYWMYVVDYQHMRHAVHDLSFHIVDMNGTLTVQYNLYVPIRKMETTSVMHKLETSTESWKFTTTSTKQAATVTQPESFYNVFDD